MNGLPDIPADVIAHFPTCSNFAWLVQYRRFASTREGFVVGLTAEKPVPASGREEVIRKGLFGLKEIVPVEPVFEMQRVHLKNMWVEDADGVTLPTVEVTPAALRSTAEEILNHVRQKMEERAAITRLTGLYPPKTLQE